MQKKDVLALASLGAEAAIAAVDGLYAEAGWSEQKLAKLRILACHLNNLWPDSLQVALERWVNLPAAEPDSDDWRQLHCFWVSLYKKKGQLRHRYEVLADFCRQVDLYMAPGNTKVTKSQFSKDVFVDAWSSFSSEQANRNILALSALFYYANKADGKMPLEPYQSQMRNMFNWYGYNASIVVDPAVLAIHFVHSEGVDQMNLVEAKRLLEAKQLGWLSFWHLFQLSNRVLDDLARSKPDCTDEAKAVLEAMYELRFNR